MATIQRNVKTYGTRKFVDEVSAAPSHYAPVLSNEVDADLDTVYAAWNGGVDAVNIKDGSITFAKLAPDAQLWRDTGTSLTPGINYANRPLELPVSGVNTALSFGSHVVKGRLVQHPTVDACFLTANATINPAGSAWIQDDGAKASWLVTPAVFNDQFNVQRIPPGNIVPATLLTVDPTGNCTTAAAIFSGGPVLIKGAGTGIRCQNVGTLSGDGYSANVAFGWDGTLKVRVDSSTIGTVTVTSDVRVKQGVHEDVPGLDAVLALRPISFEYDQSARPIGFEKGRHYGLIAQDVEPHVPLVLREEVWDSEKPDESRFALQFFEFIPVLIQAIKDLTARVAAVEVAVA
jgi:hypothetical protein